MPRAELAGYLEFAHRTAQRAGEAILPHFRRAIEVQDKRNFMGYDPVTVADHAAEQVIRDAIKAAYPRTASTARSMDARPGHRR
jgi:myo-inositol-1(or 4)-monophosphatase